jgi:hypothetical protein
MDSGGFVRAIAAVRRVRQLADVRHECVPPFSATAAANRILESKQAKRIRKAKMCATQTA